MGILKKTFLHNSDSRNTIAMVLCIIMMAGFLFSRALLSMSMVGLMLLALYPEGMAARLHRFTSNKFYWLSTAFFMAYVLSGLWSSNSSYWLQSIINKLPFIMLPIGFTALSLNTEGQQRTLLWGILSLQSVILVYSICLFLGDTQTFIQGYNVSAALPTTKYNDHIRFSISLVVSIVMIVYVLLEHKENLPRWQKILLYIIALLFALYIHLLAAKTGIVCLYLALLLLLLFKGFYYNKIIAAVSLCLICCMPWIMYKTIPTFRTKIDYVGYEIAQYKIHQRYDYTLSDAGRMITYDIGTKAIAQHWLTGVGAGDVMDEMRLGYSKYYPEVVLHEQYGPVNQYLFTALCVGIPLSLVLLVMSIMPFFMRYKHQIYLSITAAIMLFCIMVESMLEVQFGVFIYLYYLLLWMAMLVPKQQHDTAVNSQK